MAKISKMPRCLKISCGILVLLLVILLVVAIALYFTILKPKQPKVETQSVYLKNFKLAANPFELDVTLAVSVIVNNRNYGSFKYQNSTTYVTYRGIPAAKGFIQENNIPARGKLEMGTTVVIQGENLVTDPSFWGDYFAGCLNFTASTTLHGKATVFKLLKIKATTESICEISVFVSNLSTTSVCTSNLK